MKIAFDAAKDETNRAKHGLSLALAEVLFASSYVVAADDRFDYGERRMVAFGKIHERLMVCVFTDRAGERRVISLRKANLREQRRHG